MFLGLILMTGSPYSLFSVVYTISKLTETSVARARRCAPPPHTLGKRLDVYSREVDWSSTSQLRTSLDTDFGIEAIFEDVFSTSGIVKELDDGDVDTTEHASKVLLKTAVGANYAYLFQKRAEDGSSSICLHYREIPFPWPLSNRDLFVVGFERKRES